MASGVNRAVVERGSVNVTHTDVARASAYARSTEAKVNANAGWSSHHSRIAPAADGGPIRSAQNTSHNEDAATTSDKDSVTAPPVDHCGHDTAQAEYARALHSGPRLWSVEDRKSTRLNSSHVAISYAVFCLKQKQLTTLDALNAK